jgi:hypothetical protein
VEAIASLSPPAIEGEIIVERGVLVGGLMVFGSFLLATLLNRSAMEEIPPAPPPPPVTLVAPINPPAVDAGLAPSAGGCAAPDAPLNSNAPLTQTDQAAPDCPGSAD